MNAPALVLGGGPIGLVCALLLARRGYCCELVDARPLEALRRDRRLLALSRGTLLALEPLLGAAFAPMGPIERVRVSSRGNPGAALLSAADVGASGLGATVWYADLVDALARAASAQERIRIQRPRRAQRVLQHDDRVEALLDDGSVLAGALAIDAEGAPAPAPASARVARFFALLADLRLSAARPGEAFERFTPEGPLALLPLPRTPAQADASGMSMIWCLPADLARARQDMAPEELLALLGEALGPRLGAPQELGPRNVFPLLTHRLERVCEHRLVHLGNAAQSLHPVAGQGFNLGIRDCVCLVQCLAECDPPGRTTDGAGAGALEALARYRARRRLDRALVPAVTGALPRLFSSRLAPVVAARSLALAALDLLPGPRRQFTRLMMLGTPR